MKTPTQADVELVANIVECAAKRWPDCRFGLAQLVAEQREQAVVQSTEELRIKNAELLHTLKIISGMWIKETTPSSPPDALAERMAKLALAATLRKTP